MSVSVGSSASRFSCMSIKPNTFSGALQSRSDMIPRCATHCVLFVLRMDVKVDHPMSIDHRKRVCTMLSAEQAGTAMARITQL